MQSELSLPFAHEGDDRGVLCIHGFTATPYEMHYVGRRLADLGMTVVGMLLPGHGGTAADLDATTWHDWYAGVEAELARLRARCGRIAVVGQSLGGLLTLHTARHHGRELAAVASLGAPLWLTRGADLAIRALRRLRLIDKIPPVPKAGGPDVRDREMKARTPTLRVFPPRATRSLWDFAGIVRAELDGVTTPIFVGHGRHDHVAPPACADEIVRRVASRDVRQLWLEDSFHIVPLDVDRDRLASELGRFLVERLR